MSVVTLDFELALKEGRSVDAVALAVFCLAQAVNGLGERLDGDGLEPGPRGALGGIAKGLDSIADAIGGFCDVNVAIVSVDDGPIDQTAKALREIGTHIKYLGNGDAASPMGAIEALGVVMKDGMGRVSSSLDGVAQAIEEGTP